MPTEFTLKRLLEASFVDTKKGTISNETYRMDLCCRSLHKCDAYKRIEFNYIKESDIRHCECVHSFQRSLENMNTSLSNEFAFIHTINTAKCYAKDHPIIECITFESKTGPIVELMSSVGRDFFPNRCLKYDLN